MKPFPHLFSFCWLLLSFTARAQQSDTSLYTLYSAPFFYNVVKTDDGSIIVGSSDGMYQMDDHVPRRINSTSGYVALDQLGKAIINPDGIKYHEGKNLIHLIPFAQEKSTEFHVANDDFIYLTSGGKLYVYQLLPYAILYKNKSIRTISPHFIGTYSGVYFKGKKIPHPTFSDGYIREVNGNVFICYSSIMIGEQEANSTIRWLDLPQSPFLDGQRFRDVLYSQSAMRYYLQTTNMILGMDTGFRMITPYFTSTEKANEVVLLGEDSSRHSILFAAGRFLYKLLHKVAQPVKIDSVPNQILDGHISLLNYYLLTSDALYVRRSDGTLEQLTKLKKAHTLRALSTSELVIGTDNGLYLYNLIRNRLTLLIPNVEFNRRALFVNNGQLYAGSLTGLYKLEIKRLEEIQNRLYAPAPKNQLPFLGWILAIALVIVISLLTGMVIRYRKKLTLIQSDFGPLETKELPKPTRQQLIDYLNDHLPEASVQAMADHFQMNTATVYTILDPDKPGALIQELRLTKVKQLRNEGATAKDIAVVTGFSASYIRKIWNNLLPDDAASS